MRKKISEEGRRVCGVLQLCRLRDEAQGIVIDAVNAVD
jgi:hypothetical protein